MDKVIELLKELEHTKFYGGLEIKFEAGHVVLVRKTETIKPTKEDFRDTRGTDNERHT